MDGPQSGGLSTPTNFFLTVKNYLHLSGTGSMLFQLQSTGRVSLLPPPSIYSVSSVLRTCRRTASTMPRPYTFHVCANWLSAPPEHGMRKRSVPFPADSPVGIWRDLSLTWPRPGGSKTPGEDFFYVQEVRVPEAPSSELLNCIVSRCETSR
jgi:hypothetical protein